MPALKLLHVVSREQWRTWLADHHARETEIWLVYHKRHTGEPRIPYDEAVEEALCFGWIDSIVRRLDDDRYAQKFTPRRTNSRWSGHNLRRFARMVREGRMTEAGLAKAPPPLPAAPVPGTAADLPPPPAETAKPARPEAAAAGVAVPGDVEAALRAREPAWVNFTRLAPSYRRLYVGWIENAKKPATRARRLAEAVDLLARNQRLGLK